MDITIHIDLEAAIASALAPEKLAPILDKHLTDAITSAIRGATGYGSPFSKGLEEQFKTALPHGLGVDDVAKFQHILNASMREVLRDANSDAITAALQKCVHEVMPDVPAKIKLSQLVEDARGGLHKEQHEAFYAYWEPSEYGGGHLYLDQDELPSKGYGSHSSREDVKYNAAYSLAVTNEGEVYSLKFGGKEITPASRPNVISRFQAILMAMYVGRTRLEVDIDDDDVQSAATEQCD